MAKGYILIDIPSGCHECKLSCNNYWTEICGIVQDEVFDFIKNKTKPEWCPIKVYPESEFKPKYRVKPDLRVLY